MFLFSGMGAMQLGMSAMHTQAPQMQGVPAGLSLATAQPNPLHGHPQLVQGIPGMSPFHAGMNVAGMAGMGGLPAGYPAGMAPMVMGPQILVPRAIPRPPM